MPCIFAVHIAVAQLQYKGLQNLQYPMHCNSTVTSTGNIVASRSYCIFTVVTFYSVQRPTVKNPFSMTSITREFKVLAFRLYQMYLPLSVKGI